MKVDWEKEKDNLESLIKNGISYVEIGKRYGVTNNAVRKAARKLGIVEERRKINEFENFGKHSNDVTDVCKECGKEFSHAKYLGVVDFCSEECKTNYHNKKRLEIKEPNIKEHYTKKQIGELGEQIVIGELGKFGIQTLIPLSDNLPFDLVVYTNNKFYKCQVKTRRTIKNGAITFGMRTGLNTKHPHSYTKDEVDVFILCDLEHIFLLTFDEFHKKTKTQFALRYSSSVNKQSMKVNYASDYVISTERLKEVFT